MTSPENGLLAQSGIGPLRQARLYRDGMEGYRSTIPISYELLEESARSVLSREAYDYVAGGAGAESTCAANLRVFRETRIVPRMARDVSDRDLSVELFGSKLPAPVLLAPVGVTSVIHPDADCAVAGAAKELGIPAILSSLSARSIEEVAEIGAMRWFQLYMPSSRELASSFVSRAERAGYSAIVVTLDTAMIGWRERDLQSGYLPFLKGEGIANYLTDPVFRSMLAKPPRADMRKAIEMWAQVVSTTKLTWEEIAFLRSQTTLPILVKGVLHPDDAALAVEHGMDGIIVSNHGGRQVDGAIAALDALPEIASASRGKLKVLFDSGIRRGADIFKAIAQGADAVLIGRPFVWGLALAGEPGVREVIMNLVAEFDCTLALSGYQSVDELRTAGKAAVTRRS